MTNMTRMITMILDESQIIELNSIMVFITLTLFLDFHFLDLDDSLVDDFDDSSLDKHDDTSKEDDLDEPNDSNLDDIDDSD